MTRIFISYRRDDSAGYVGWLSTCLAKHFPANDIFRDVTTIEPGVDFVKVIEDAVGSCAVLLAIIGKQWLTISDDAGNRRLFAHEDFVHLEIETALRRDIRVIPILVGRATMPSANALPEDLKLLARLNAFELTDKDFDRQVDDLAAVLRRAFDDVAARKAREQLVADLKIEWCSVPAGEVIIQGKTEQVEAFRISKYPITYRQYELFVNNGGYTAREYWTEMGWEWKEQKLQPEIYWQDPHWHIPDHPVVGVTWYEAVAFCNWLNAIMPPSGEVIYLPTEEQYQRAGQGDDGRVYPWGNDFDPTKCNTLEGGIGKTTPVTQFPQGASPYGALDISGNVWGWSLNEWYDARSTGLDGDAPRVVQGGSWASPGEYARIDSRYKLFPNDSNHNVGFRVCASSSR